MICLSIAQKTNTLTKTLSVRPNVSFVKSPGDVVAALMKVYAMDRSNECQTLSLESSNTFIAMQYIHYNIKWRWRKILNFTKCEIYLNEQAQKNKLDRVYGHDAEISIANPFLIGAKGVNKTTILSNNVHQDCHAVVYFHRNFPNE